MAQCDRRWFRAPARCRSETGAPCKGGAALTLAWRGVIGAGFALPRDAGRTALALLQVLNAEIARAEEQMTQLLDALSEAEEVGGGPDATEPDLVTILARGRGWETSRWRGCSPGGSRRCAVVTTAACGWRRGWRRCAPSRPCQWASLTLAWRGVIGAGFALPRDAGRDACARPPTGRTGLPRSGEPRALSPANPPGLRHRRITSPALPAAKGVRDRRWFRASVCRSEAPTGRTGQRSKPSLSPARRFPRPDGVPYQVSRRCVTPNIRVALVLTGGNFDASERQGPAVEEWSFPVGR